MSKPDKTAAISLIDLVDVPNHLTTATGFVKGTEVSVQNAIRGVISLFNGFHEVGANAGPQKWIIRTSGSASGDDTWGIWQTVNITFTGTTKIEPLTATEAAGVSSIAVAATADYVAGDEIFIHDGNDATQSEWGIVNNVVVNTSIELVDGLTTGKDSGDDCFDNPQINHIPIELEGMMRLQVLYSNRAVNGMHTSIKALLTITHSYKS